MNKKLKQVINGALPKVKKVYCKNCIWSNKRVFDVNKFCPELRNTLRREGINLTYCGDRRRVEMISSEECSYYQRKWYKFWVK